MGGGLSAAGRGVVAVVLSLVAVPAGVVWVAPRRPWGSCCRLAVSIYPESQRAWWDS